MADAAAGGSGVAQHMGAATPPTSSPKATTAVQLPGDVIDWNATAVLVSPGPGNANYAVYSTTADVSHSIDASTALADGTIDTVPDTGSPLEDAMLSDPSPSHPNGTTLVVVEATTAAQGLTPSTDRPYLLVYDNDSGRLVSGPVAFGDGAIPQVVENDGNTGTLITGGMVDRVQLSTGDVLASASYSGDFIASGYKMFVTTELATSSSTSCQSYVYSAVTLKLLATVAQCTDNGDASFVASGAVDIANALYSTVTGQPLLSYDASAATLVTTGPRSKLVVISDSTNQNAPTVYDTGSWAQVYTVPNAAALSFSVLGMADDDIWATTTSQNLVLSARTGQILSTDWSELPVAGDSGWTVFADYPPPTTGDVAQYLVRSPEPAFEAMQPAAAAAAAGTAASGGA